MEKYAGYTTADTLYGNAASGRDRNGQSDMDKMWFAQKKVVTDLAEKEPCVDMIAALYQQRCSKATAT